MSWNFRMVAPVTPTSSKNVSAEYDTSELCHIHKNRAIPYGSKRPNVLRLVYIFLNILNLT